MTRHQWVLLMLISQTVCNNKKLYKQLSTTLTPEDNRGEAFYGTKGDYHELVKLAETGKLCPIFIWSLQFERDENGIQYKDIWYNELKEKF